MEQYDNHIFVCLGKRCKEKGSEEVLDMIKEFSKVRGLKEKGLIVSRSGCLKACKETEVEGEYAPLVVVYPGGVWYKNVTTGDAEEILDATMDGSVVERLLHFNLKN